MKITAPRSNFYNELTDYAGSLARLSPDTFDYVLRPGDTVNIGIKFMGYRFKQEEL